VNEDLDVAALRSQFPALSRTSRDGRAVAFLDGPGGTQVPQSEEPAEALPAERVRPAGEQPPGHRFETGTLSHEAIAGFIAAVEYLASLGGGGTALGSARRR
jgi:selenocysteine lyase/cysteine desulfurase